LLRERLDRAGRGLSEAAGRLAPALTARLHGARMRLTAAGAGLAPRQLRQSQADAARRLARAARDLDRAGAATLTRAADRRERAARLLETLSHKATLRRGFALVRDADGRALTAAAAVAPGAALSLEFHDGAVSAVAAGGPAPEPKKRARPAPKQGSLF
jgi:exodeoxyribonuclease VII large subunit